MTHRKCKFDAAMVRPSIPIMNLVGIKWGVVIDTGDNQPLNQPVESRDKNRERALSNWVIQRWRKFTQRCREYKYTYRGKLFEEWKARDKRHGKLFETTENIISTMYGRIHKLLRNKTNLDYAMKSGGDTAFLCTTLAVIMNSKHLRDTVLSEIIEPVIVIMGKSDRAMTSLAIMVANALLLLGERPMIEKHCLPHIRINNLDHETFQVLKNADKYTYPYKSLLVDSVTLYFQSWAFYSIPSFMKLWVESEGDKHFVTADEIIQVVMDITYSQKWLDLDEPLLFQKNKILKQADTNRDKIYFLTHVLFIGNHYGTRPLDPALITAEEKAEFFDIFLRWFWEFIDKDAIKENIEEFSEVSYCLLYLSNSLGCKIPIPNRLTGAVNEFIRLAEQLSKNGPAKHAWYPSDKGYRYDTYCDIHSLIVVASLLAESLRFKQHLHPILNEAQPIYNTSLDDCPDEFEPPVVAQRTPVADLNVLLLRDQEKYKNKQFQKLTTDGYVFVTAGADITERWCGELSPITRKIMDVHEINPKILDDILIRVPPSPEAIDVFRPSGKKMKTYKDQIADLHLPDNFWDLLQKRIAKTLGLPTKRIRMMTDETYIRLKRGPDAQTNQHSDFFYFIRETDAMARIHPTYGSIPAEDGICQVCMNEKGKVFKNITIGPTCARGYLPVFTTWLSLGDFSQDEYSLLEVVPQSHLFKGYDTALHNKHAITKGLVPLVEFPASSWRYPNSDGVKKCDMLIFNCKTLHRAEPPKKKSKDPRLSIDARFVILPDV
jgi:hypothetical protein